MSTSSQDRRRFKRLQAPVYCRPAGMALRREEQVADISVGGMRVYTDDVHKAGSRLEMELFLPSGKTVTLLAEVVWVEELAQGSPAKFDIGLRYVDLTPEEEAVIGQVLGPEEP